MAARAYWQEQIRLHLDQRFEHHPIAKPVRRRHTEDHIFGLDLMTRRRMTAQ